MDEFGFHNRCMQLGPSLSMEIDAMDIFRRGIPNAVQRIVVRTSFCSDLPVLSLAFAVSSVSLVVSLVVRCLFGADLPLGPK